MADDQGHGRYVWVPQVRRAADSFARSRPTPAAVSPRARSTRDPSSSDAAKALAATAQRRRSCRLTSRIRQACEAAFSGAYGAFCVTVFWVDFSPVTEMRHAETMANAAKAAGVQHVIWSTLEDTRTFIPLDDDRMPTLQENYKVPHFDGKEDADAAFRSAGVPTTFLRTAFYWENLIYFGLGPQRRRGGVLRHDVPDGASRPPDRRRGHRQDPLGVFKRGPEFIGETIAVLADHGSRRWPRSSASARRGMRATTTSTPTYPRLRLPVRTRSEHVPVSATSTAQSPERATGASAIAQPETPGLRCRGWPNA